MTDSALSKVRQDRDELAVEAFEKLADRIARKALKLRYISRVVATNKRLAMNWLDVKQLIEADLQLTRFDWEYQALIQRCGEEK